MSALWTPVRASATATPPTSPDATCSICKGRGGWTEERIGHPVLGPNYTCDTYVVCVCTQRRAEHRFLERCWPELLNAPVVEPNAALVHQLERCWWVTGVWSSMAPHIRAAVIAKYRQREGSWRVRVYRDAQLPALVHADRTARSLGDRDVETIDDDAPLMVIRIGFAAARNAAISTAIADLISARTGRSSRALWIIDDPRHPLAKGNPAWSEGLDEVLKNTNLPHDSWGAE